MEAIAIDGPAGAGKTSVARGVAERLGWRCLDTGAMYRALALAALERKMDLARPPDEAELARLAAAVRIEFAPPDRVLLDGRDVTAAIRAPEVTRAIRPIADSPAVRERMRERQRELAAGGRVVVEGRDIGTFVLPRARWKFFLEAAPEERVRRRAAELAAPGRALDAAAPAALAEELARRDAEDERRTIAPLYPAADAVRLDTTGLTLEETIDAIVKRVRP